MRRIQLLLISLVFLLPALAGAQIQAPQINLTGNIGCQGFPCLNNGTLVMTDANHTMTTLETSAMFIKVTGTLTATRTITVPAGRFPFFVENATTGGQSITLVSASGGTGVTIANGQGQSIWYDGTNFTSFGAAAGLTSFNGRTGPAITLLAADVQAAVTGQAGCSTAGYVYSPQSNTCVAPGGSTGVSSFNTRTGAVVLNTTDVNSAQNGASVLFRNALVPTSGPLTQGDSTVQGLAASTPSAIFGAQLANDLPGGWRGNWGLSDTVSTTIAIIGWQNWNPQGYGSSPFITLEAGVNDANLLGVSTGQQNHLTLSMIGIAAHEAVPFADQQMASQAGASTGSWAPYTNNSLPINAGTGGTLMSSTTSGSTRTYTLPAGPGVVYVWGASDSSTGTFTVSVNGTLQTNLCTGTTTFDSFGCNGVTIANGGYSNTGYAMFGQAFAGNTGSSNVVVVTTTNTGLVIDGAAMTIPAGLSPFTGAPIVALQGVLPQQAGAAAAATAAFNTAMQAAYTSLSTVGLANIIFVDVRNGVAAGAGYPAARAINTTTDFQAPCNGCGGLHPGDGGEYVLAKIYESAAAAAGYPVALPNVGGAPQWLAGGTTLESGYNAYPDFRTDLFLNPHGYLNNGGPAPGLCLFRNPTALGSQVLSNNCNARISYDNWSYTNTAQAILIGGTGGDYAVGIGCQENAGAMYVTQCPLLSDNLWGSQFTGGVFIGASGPPVNGDVTLPASNVGNALNIASMVTQTGAGGGSKNTTVTYLESGSTSYQLGNCKNATSGGNDGYGYRQPHQWFYVDSATSIASLAFNANQSGGFTDLVNGATSVTYTNVPPYTMFEAQCSQATATTTTWTITEQLANPAPQYFSTTVTIGEATFAANTCNTAVGVTAPSWWTATGSVQVTFTSNPAAAGSGFGGQGLTITPANTSGGTVPGFVVCNPTSSSITTSVASTVVVKLTP